MDKEFARRIIQVPRLQRWSAVWLALVLWAAGFARSLCVAQPVLSLQVLPGNPSYAQITLSNCSDTYFKYATEMSTDLVHWVNIATNQAAATNIPVLVPNNLNAAFFRVAKIPSPPFPFGFAVAMVNALDMHGNGMVVDSFDSSSTNYSTGGQYDATKRKADGSVLATAGITNSAVIGNANIYGHVYTGPGVTNLQVGPQGAVGDAAWIATSAGVEPGYWTDNYSISFPDVPTPGFVGSALPSPNSHGNIVLTKGNYTTAATNAPTEPLVISNGVANLWVQGSFALPQISITNDGSLILYVGTSLGSGDTLSFGGNGAFNSPGYATNLVIYGLPSLSNITASGNNAIDAAIYAPEANFSGKGGGNNALDYSGSLVVNSVTLDGHCNFHFDESLIYEGPIH